MRIVAYLVIIFMTFGFQGSRQQIIKWVVIPGGSLRVDGKTNINTFSCAITQYNKPDTINVNRSAAQPVSLRGNLILDVKNFNCHNPIMTADLRKTLKAKEFPNLVISFLSLSNYPSPEKQELKGWVLIELAGVTKKYEVDYVALATDNRFVYLTGTRKVNFSDFNLIPPRKLGGMIKTENELSVVFTIQLKEIS